MKNKTINEGLQVMEVDVDPELLFYYFSRIITRNMTKAPKLDVQYLYPDDKFLPLDSALHEDSFGFLYSTYNETKEQARQTWCPSVIIAPEID